MGSAHRLFSLLTCLALAACGGGTHTPGDDDVGGDGDADGDADGNCVDLDGDGAGIGDDCATDDCDDTDPRTIAECGEDCAASPERLGCPCSDGRVVACYHGPEGTAGEGACVAGLKTCTGGTWSGCDGQVLPSSDDEIVCDYADDDCDGEIDEGVQGICGDCNEDCFEKCVGIACEVPFREDEGRSIVENPDGSITLSGAASVSNFVLWVANTGEGTVSKINTRTREEEGRYITMPPEIAEGWAASPSRTTVNPHGDVVVSNRHEPTGGSTKIMASDCPDQDHDGIVETSSGGDDVLEWGEDECVVWYVTDITAARGSAFEIRADLDGNNGGGIHEYVWVASYSFSNLGSGTIYEIDSVDGEKTGREIPDTPGYGLAMGPGGLLWSVGLSLCPRSTDTTSLEQTRYEGCGGAYGIAVDSDGRPWIGSSTSRLDLDTGIWEQPVDANGNLFAVHGGGITVDTYGNAYTGEWPNGGGGGSAYKIDAETMEVTALPGMGGHGWAVDFDGFIWSVDMVDSAHVMDPETLEAEAVRPPLVSPYTYSDMTGFQLQNTSVPAGVYEHVFETCDPLQPVHLNALVWDAVVPEGSAVSFRLKHADSLEALEQMAWIDVASVPSATSPVDLDPILRAAGGDIDHAGHYVMVEATLQSIDRLERPTLSSFAIRYSCGTGFQ